MIAGTGIDLVDVRDFSRLLEDRASSFEQATFGQEELAYCYSAASGVPERHLAARYAAKEAVVKALDQACSLAGITQARIPLICIELRRDRQGRPHVALRGEAHELAVRLGIDRTWVSVSHDGDMAMASVVMERLA